MRIACIVEGHGEVEAVPILLRRVASLVAPSTYLEIGKPIRVPRSSLVIAEELQKYIELAGRQVDGSDGILVLIDADDDAPCELGPKLLTVCQAARTDRRSKVVIAKKEFEAWFLAAAVSLRGKRGLANDLEPPLNPEAIRDAKGWLSRHNIAGRSYKETLDQPALTAIFDLEAAMSTSSFKKLVRDMKALLSPDETPGGV